MASPARAEVITRSKSTAFFKMALSYNQFERSCRLHGSRCILGVFPGTAVPGISNAALLLDTLDVLDALAPARTVPSRPARAAREGPPSSQV